MYKRHFLRADIDFIRPVFGRQSLVCETGYNMGTWPELLQNPTISGEGAADREDEAESGTPTLEVTWKLDIRVYISVCVFVGYLALAFCLLHM